jgi:hypothetical protein
MASAGSQGFCLSLYRVNRIKQVTCLQGHSETVVNKKVTVHSLEAQRPEKLIEVN